MKHLIKVDMGSTGVSAYVIETEESSEALAEIQSMFGFQGTHHNYHITYMGEVTLLGDEIVEAVAEVRREIEHERQIIDDEDEPSSNGSFITYTENLVEKLEALL